MTKSIKIIESSYVDKPGESFNGLELSKFINKNTNYDVKQLVCYKLSDDDNSFSIYDNFDKQIEQKLIRHENDLSIHNCLSLSSNVIKNNEYFKNSDIVHYHMIHNAKISLFSLLELSNLKKTVISIHDPWIFTGRCVHFYDCNKYLTGCNNCPHLETLFPFEIDNCNKLWNLKKYIYDNIDVDFIVHSNYMYDLFNNSPLTKGKRVHLIPLGTDIDFYKDDLNKEQLKKEYNIDKNNIVLFFRAGDDFKGTKYIKDALKNINSDKKITLITCSEIGLLDELKEKYQIIDMGIIDKVKLKECYTLCDIFLMPSIGESFGMMAIEAMSMSRPIIVFNNTALPSVTFAPSCGVLANNLSSESLKEKMLMLINDEGERVKRGKLGRKLAVENYNVDNYNNQMLKLYGEVYNRKHKKCDVPSSYENNSETEYLKKILNDVSRNITSDKEILYKVKKVKKVDINFGSINNQVLIDEYNKKLYECTRKKDVIIKKGIKYKIKKMINLLIKDNSKLKNIIKSKIRSLK